MSKYYMTINSGQYEECEGEIKIGDMKMHNDERVYCYKINSVDGDYLCFFNTLSQLKNDYRSKVRTLAERIQLLENSRYGL